MIFDSVTAAEARDAALDQVERGASDAWKNQVMSVIYQVALALPEFIIDDVWKHSGMPPPEREDQENRIMGALMSNAARSGWITSTGEYARTESIDSHAGGRVKWRSLIYGQTPLAPMPEQVPQTMKNIWQAVRNCEACPLVGPFGRCVPGLASRWGDDIAIMAVAEAPGAEEAKNGRPMEGAAGKEFNRLLTVAGIDRSRAIITNVLKARPNSKNKIIDVPKEYIDKCSRMWLRRELQIAQPKIVVAIGATAIEYFLPDYGSVALAHRIPRYAKLEGVWEGIVYPVYHTAAGMHNPSLKKEIEDDFVALGQLLRGELEVHNPGPPDTSGYYDTWDTHAVAWKIKQAGIVAIDTESDEDGFWGASFSTTPGEGIVITQGANFEPISQVLETGDVEIIMHNAYYDLKILKEAGIRVNPARLRDTMVAAYLCGEESQGLKNLTYRHLHIVMTRYEELVGHYGAPRAIAYLQEAVEKEYPRTIPETEIGWGKDSWTKAQKEADPEGYAARQAHPIWKTTRSKPVHTRIEALIKDIEEKGADPFERWKGWDDWLKEWIVQRVGRPFPQSGISDVPDFQQAVAYSACDADMTLQLWPKMLAQMEALGVTDAFYNLESPLTPILVEMSEEGIGINLEYLQNLSDEFAQRIKQNLDSTWARAGHFFNPSSPIQVPWILAQHDITLTKQNKSRTGTSTDDDALEPFKEHPVVKGILEHRRLEKLKSTYIDAYLALGKDRIHTTWKQTRTATYRLASSDPNLQNVGKRGEGKLLRKAFVARPGHVLMAFDYSQIEMRWMAVDAQDQGMIDAFRRNEDIHGNTMWDMWEVNKVNTDHDRYEELRTIAKGLNFGIIFGIAAQGFAKQNPKIGRNDEERLQKSQEYIDLWFEARPKVKERMESRKLQVIKDGFVRDAFGRYRWVPGAQSPVRWVREAALRESINMPIQGGAAGQMKLAMIEVHRRLKEGGFLTKLLLQVHDELILEVPFAEVKSVYHLVTQAMEDVYDLGIPTPVEAEIGYDWGGLEEYDGGDFDFDRALVQLSPVQVLDRPDAPNEYPLLE